LRKWFLLLITFLLLSLIVPACADKGMIPVSPDISVYEPGQKAIIAWDGEEEILILSTNTVSSEETLVLEILPLPSKPTVESASFHSFEEVQRLIWEEGVNLYGTLGKEGARAGGVDVVFHEKIGAHDVTVVMATGSSELVDWMEDFLEENSVTETPSLGNLEPAVEDYMGRGFRYYVLDIITVSSEERSVDPILYRFDSAFLYYPLLITSPVEGSTDITLFLLTQGQVIDGYYLLQKASYQVSGGSWKPIEFQVSQGELSKIDLRIGSLFEGGAWLTTLKYEGELKWLTEDLMITQDSITPGVSEPDIYVEIAFPPTIVILCFVLGAVCTLIGVFCTLLLTSSKWMQKKKRNES